MKLWAIGHGGELEFPHSFLPMNRPVLTLGKERRLVTLLQCIGPIVFLIGVTFFTPESPRKFGSLLISKFRICSDFHRLQVG